MDVIEARADKVLAENKRHDKYLNGLAYIVPQLVAKAVWDGKKYPKKDDIFPDPDARSEDDQPKWKKEQAGFAAWVEAYNNKRRRSG